MEKQYIVNLTPILSIPVGCKLHPMGQSKGISLQHSTPAMNSLQLCGKKPNVTSQASVPFWKGRNRLRQPAVKTQQPGVPLAMKLLEDPTAGWHKGDWLPARPRHRSHYAQPGALRDLLWFSIFSPRRCLLRQCGYSHSTCWGLTGLGAGDYMTPRLECHLLNHHQRCLWQFD